MKNMSRMRRFSCLADVEVMFRFLSETPGVKGLNSIGLYGGRLKLFNLH